MLTAVALGIFLHFQQHSMAASKAHGVQPLLLIPTLLQGLQGHGCNWRQA